MYTILVIDDDVSGCETLAMYLTEEGYDVITANTGLAGLKKFIEHRIDLVILDIRLPDINGFEVLKRLKKTNEGINVIMITAFHDKASTNKAVEIGAFEYIRKPININDMEIAIKNALTNATVRPMHFRSSV
jgi:two-component system response regulator AtoC